jgi:putative redox protein
MSIKTGTVVWQNDLDFSGVTGSGYQFAFSGQSGLAGASPMEMVLAAAAGCSAMDVISILKKKRQPVTGFTVEVAGVRAAEHPMTFTEIDMLYIVHGEAVDPAAVARAIELSQTKYCSVGIMLQNAGITIRTSFRIEPAEEVTTNSQQLTANSQQPTANSQQLTANSQQLTANS